MPVLCSGLNSYYVGKQQGSRGYGNSHTHGNQIFLLGSPYGSPLENFNIFFFFEARSAEDKHTTTALRFFFGPHVITKSETTI